MLGLIRETDAGSSPQILIPIGDHGNTALDTAAQGTQSNPSSFCCAADVMARLYWQRLLPAKLIAPTAEFSNPLTAFEPKRCAMEF